MNDDHKTRAELLAELTALRQRNAVLEAGVKQHWQTKDRRSQLETQLHQSQKMEAIGTLAGGIAHEFNNILHIIFTYMSLAQIDIAPDHPALPHLQEVDVAVHRMKDLVQQILTFSRQSDIDRKSLTLSVAVKGALRFLRASLSQTIELRQHIVEEGSTVLADATQMHQILMNLCCNAEHAMRNNVGQLDVRLEPVEIETPSDVAALGLCAGPYVRLTVRDTGVGIPSDIQERIFEPFYTTKSVGCGTGMGLAIVHGIVTSYDGAITVDSVPGEGAAFHVYLPRYLEPLEDATSESTIAEGKGVILFVDDEAALARGLERLLMKLGYEVLAYTNPQEALDLFTSEPERVDLVITDQAMPQMTGLQLAYEMRGVRSDIPIILCTGFSHTMTADEAQLNGIDAFCLKPLNASELSTTIQEVLSQRTVPPQEMPQRILLIDDDDQFRLGLCRLLEVEGFEVVGARDGREGVRCYREAPADVVITDLLMPVQEGVETIQELKQEFPNVKIIAISGGGQGGKLDFLHVAERLGAQRTLRKPFSRDDLVLVIQEVFQA